MVPARSLRLSGVNERNLKTIKKEAGMSALIRYESPVSTLSNLFDEFFGAPAFSRWGRELSPSLYPDVDILEDKDAYRIKADLPGMDRKDIKVEIDNGVLTISGEKKEEKSERGDGRFCHFERSYGSFSRSFRLPEYVDPSNVGASYNGGVLELTLKKTEKAKPKAIEVKID
jgi:HSP20 family protein